MLGRKKGFRVSGLVRLRWHGFHYIVLGCTMTTSHIFSDSLIDCKGARGGECGLIPRELTVLTGNLAKSTCAINIVNRLQCFLSLGTQNAGLVGRLCDISGRTTEN